MGVSRFLWEDFLRMQHENLFPVLLDAAGADASRAHATALRDDLARRLSALDATAARVEALNAFKDREMFRIDLRHITGRSDFTEFADELSQLAEVMVATAAELAQADLDRQFGAPRLADGRRCAWSIGALGKFGGRELGFGSDLELIVVYEGEGATDGPAPTCQLRATSVASSRPSGDMLRARREGVFEIDLRLRPHGKAGHSPRRWTASSATTPRAAPPNSSSGWRSSGCGPSPATRRWASG